MRNILLLSLVTESNQSLLDEYLNKNDVPDEQIIEAIAYVDNNTHNIHIKERLIQYLIIKDIVLDQDNTTDSPQRTEHLQLIQRLFIFALVNKKFEAAENFLEQYPNPNELLNQTKSNHLLVNYFFNNSTIDAVAFLIKKGAEVNNQLINAIALSKSIPLLELIIQYNSSLNATLLVHIFRLEMLNKNLVRAASILEDESLKDSLLNQTDLHGTPLVQELFYNEDLRGVEFLIKNGALINKTNRNKKNLVTLVCESENDKYLPLLNTLAENAGDFTQFTDKNKDYLFTAIHHAHNYPHLLTAILKASPDLLIKQNNRTVFTLTIANNDFVTLTRLLQHVKDTVIQRQKILRAETVTISQGQIEDCSFTLDHCMSFYNSDNEGIVGAFNAAGLSLHYNAQVTPQDNDYLFNQGLLQFLHLYHFEQSWPDLDPIKFSEFNLKIITELGLMTMAFDNIKLLANTELYKQHPVVNAFYLKGLINNGDQRYLERVRKPHIALQKQHQQEQEQREIQQQAQLIEQQKKREEQQQQARTDLAQDLPGIFNDLLTVLQEVADITNTRDKKKGRLDILDSLASSAIFVTTMVYSVLSIMNYKDEVEEGYPHAENVGICVAIYYLEFIISGFLNGHFSADATGQDKRLKFYQLPTATQDKIGTIMQRLTPLNLAIAIDPNCEVNLLVNHIFRVVENSAYRLIFAQRQQQLAVIEMPTKPELINFDWNQPTHSHEKLTLLLFPYLAALLFQFFLSLMLYSGRMDYDKHAYPKLGFAYLTTLLTYPAYLLGIPLQKKSTELTFQVKKMITDAYNRRTTNTEQGMRPLLNNQNNNDNVDRWLNLT